MTPTFPRSSLSFRTAGFPSTDITFPNERALAVWLAVRERIHKSHHKDAPTMTDYKQKLSDIAKREGVVVIAKIMVAENRAYCITESELVDLISNQRDGESPAQTFARHFVSPKPSFDGWFFGFSRQPILSCRPGIVGRGWCRLRWG